ncbi:DDE-type integrase/transposase/recombinase, partial [Enorma phocaeensis]|uniref:DDE-type integrase/transposase/recombinase n=1 Tax=Enorma phocaeensis TaxID=1871019 RepID=UPI002352E4F5
MDDMSPEPPMPAHRARPAIDPHTDWIDNLLEADLSAPRKQRHAAKRIYDRLVEERGNKGSYSSVQRHVRRWRLERAAGAGDGYLELEWAPGTTRGCARRPKGGAKQAAPQPCAAPDLVRRDFAAGGPDRLWFADITYVRTHQGWPCLAVLMDVWSRRVVGWSMSARMTAELADDALRMAIARRRPPEGCIHHSDHGSQYASLLLGKTMREAGIEPSMGSISSP